jgi:hypothetical protein
MAGAQLRYLVFNGYRLLGGLGFGETRLVARRPGSLHWLVEPPTPRNLHLVLNNHRFLLLP